MHDSKEVVSAVFEKPVSTDSDRTSLQLLTARDHIESRQVEYRQAKTIAVRSAIGVFIGLIVGKQLGIFTFAWLTTKLGVAHRPDDLTWRSIYGLAWLGGIGFTMSLFIGTLAFGDSPQLNTAKLALLVASVVSGAGGWMILRRKDERHETP